MVSSGAPGRASTVSRAMPGRSAPACATGAFSVVQFNCSPLPPGGWAWRWTSGAEPLHSCWPSRGRSAIPSRRGLSP